MKTFKVSDGDLIVITCAKYETGRVNDLAKVIRKWISDRALNVEVCIVDSEYKETDTSITVFTVNDIVDRVINDN